MVGCVAREGFAFFIKNARLLNLYVEKLLNPNKSNWRPAVQ